MKIHERSYKLHVLASYIENLKWIDDETIVRIIYLSAKVIIRTSGQINFNVENFLSPLFGISKQVLDAEDIYTCEHAVIILKVNKTLIHCNIGIECSLNVKPVYIIHTMFAAHFFGTK